MLMLMLLLLLMLLIVLLLLLLLLLLLMMHEVVVRCKRQGRRMIIVRVGIIIPLLYRVRACMQVQVHAASFRSVHTAHTLKAIVLRLQLL
jgi:hypothetical protein